jgi:hypothetical protein
VNSDNPCESMAEDIQTGIQCLEQVSFVHVKKMANAAALALAVGARTHVIDMVKWTSIPPVFEVL